jgi:hypothetical protein
MRPVGDENQNVQALLRMLAKIRLALLLQRTDALA